METESRHAGDERKEEREKKKKPQTKSVFNSKFVSSGLCVPVNAASKFEMEQGERETTDKYAVSH